MTQPQLIRDFSAGEWNPAWQGLGRLAPACVNDRARKVLGVTLTFHAPESDVDSTGSVAEGTPPADEQLGTAIVPSLSQACPKSVPSVIAVASLRAAASDADLKTLMQAAGQTNRTRFRNGVVKPLSDADLLEMTIPDKPRSSKQKYCLTAKGKDLLRGPGADANPSAGGAS